MREHHTLGRTRGTASAFLGLLLAALLPACRAVKATNATNVKVQGRQVLVDGVPLHMKGVNWNPVPAGHEHPGGVAYRKLVHGDAELMRTAGINVVRVYEPINDTDVLDVLLAHGIYVINTVIAKADTTDKFVARQVNMVKDHPAILMWAVGNEWNLNGCYMGFSLWHCLWRLRKSARVVRSLDPYHPVATIYGEVPPLDIVKQFPEADVWGINYYNGLTFEDLFWRWEALSEKPMFLAEYGADAWNSRKKREDQAAQALATGVLTEQIVEHSSVWDGVCLGGLIFSFADEWWKAPDGNISTHDTGGYAPGGGPYPDWVFNEEWWGLLEADRTPRPAYHIYASVHLPEPRAPDARSAPRLHCTAHGCVRLPPACSGLDQCAEELRSGTLTAVPADSPSLTAVDGNGSYAAAGGTHAAGLGRRLLVL